MPLLGLLDQNPAVQFDPRKFTWLGSSSSFANDAYVLIVRKDAPVKTIDDARRPGGPTYRARRHGRRRQQAATCRKSCAMPIGLHIKQVARLSRQRRDLFMAVDQK